MARPIPISNEKVLQNNKNNRFLDKPLRILKEAVGTTVLVRVRSGVEFVGELQHVDDVMNVVLGNTVEYVNGGSSARLGRIVIRGSNVEYIVLDYAVLNPDKAN